MASQSVAAAHKNFSTITTLFLSGKTKWEFEQATH